MGHLNLGKMDRQIQLQQHGPSRSPLGDEIKTWTTLASMWAEVIPVSGRQFMNATLEQPLSSKTTRFRIRYLAAARNDTKLRIVYDGQTYDVKHIAELGRREGLEIVAEAMGAT